MKYSSKTTASALCALFAAAALTGMLSRSKAQSGAGSVAANPTHGLDLSAMDTSVQPCDDFYRYANGHWLDSTTIPADYSSVGTFTILRDRNLAILRTIAERAAGDMSARPQSPEGKVGSFYRSGMDEARIEADGAAPLAPELAKIGAVRDVPTLMIELGQLHRLSVPAAFGLGIGQDAKDSSQLIVHLGQGGLGLPAPSYYVDKDKQAIRDAYLTLITKMFVLLGAAQNDAAASAANVIALETTLAAASKAPADRRDPEANYHKKTLADLDALSPGLEWQPFFTAVGLPKPGAMNVAQPEFFKVLGHAVTTTPVADWRAYLRWRLIQSAAPELSSPFVNESFHFYSTVLTGVPQMQPRWKRVLGSTDRMLGEALGQLYVAVAFPPAAEARALALVRNLKYVLRTDLASLPWMTETTRRQAIVKLDAMRIKIGYPQKWRDYSKLDVTSPSYIVNVMRAREFGFQHSLDELGKPVDRQEWGMSPPTVNAYYSANMNDINFPAGILQPPFYDPQADDAVNYGAIGSVIGHEMTHGFDDEGRKFDAKGNLRDWWTAADAQNFASRAQGIVAQYSAYEPLPGRHLNGRLTQGENIADIGGLKIAYLALEKSLQGKPHTLIDGFTPEQRFFISFAQIWRSSQRPASLRASLVTNPHSPDRYRVVGAIADMPEFRAAFHCPPQAAPTTIW